MCLVAWSGFLHKSGLPFLAVLKPQSLGSLLKKMIPGPTSEILL